MKANEYQKQAARTLIEKPGFEINDKDIMTIWTALGLIGEAGEVSEYIKKGIFHRHGIDKSILEKELGDVMWYLASIATIQGLDLGRIMQSNIDKLKIRYPNGFSSGDSMRRIDINGN